MARIGDDLHAGGPAAQAAPKTVLSADSGSTLQIPDDFISHADILRDGQDLVLKTADGHTVVVQGYFSADPHPALHSPSGALLTADMVQSFVHHAGPVELADNAMANDTSPVGVAREVHGHATIRHTDGSTETVVVGTPIHEGDVIETDGAGAVNITFRDNSSFAVSQNAKLAIDEYVFDPHSDAGTSNFSMLRGVFVYTSGLIGHADPDDVHIHTPAGSIGIRGTVIAGNVDTGTITVVEGAITLQSNTGEETTLSSQYQTAQLDTQTGHITAQGNMSASDVAAKFSSVSNVAPSFFTGLSTPEGGNSGGHETAPATTGTAPAHTDAPATGTAPAGSHGADAAPSGNVTTATAGFSGESASFGSSGDSFGSTSSSATASTAPAGNAPAAAAPAAATPPAAASAPVVGATAPPSTGTTAPVDHQPTGAVTFTGALNEDHTLAASNTLNDADGGIVGAVTYTWQHTADNGTTWTNVGTGATYMLTSGDVGDKIRVVGSYTDGDGNNDSLSSATSGNTVLHTDHQPAGTVAITSNTGTIAEDSVLTASNTLSDVDGGVGPVTYEWQHTADNGVTWTNVGAGATYTLLASDVGDKIQVVAAETDGDNITDSKASAATVTVAPTNHAPGGSLVIDSGGVALTGTPVAGQLLTAANAITDADVINTGTITYQWQHNGANITGATGSAYTVGTGDAGQTIDVVVKYTDNGGTNETVTSAVTHTVNNPPTGSVTIAGTAVEGHTLTADSSAIVDSDGLGTITYQWQDNGASITGATNATYVLAGADLGHTIDVIASYTDGGGTTEHVTSTATAAVTPDGSLTVSINALSGLVEGTSISLAGKLDAGETGVPDSDVRYTVASAVSANGTLYVSTDGGTTIATNLSAANQIFTQAQIDAGDIFFKATAQSNTTGYTPEISFSFTVDDALANGDTVTSVQTFYAIASLTITDNGSTINGGNHGDNITLSGSGAFADIINGGTGGDTFAVTGNAGGNTVNGGGGGDTFTLSGTGTGNTVNGGAGNNTFTVSGSNFTVYGDDSGNTDTGGGVNTFTVTGSGNNVTVGNYGDTVNVAGGSNNTIYSGEGSVINIVTAGNHIILGNNVSTINLATTAETNFMVTASGVGPVTVNLAGGWNSNIDGVTNVLTGTETLNTSSTGPGSTLGITVDAALTVDNIGNKITIHLNSANDVLNLDFGSNALGYHEVVVSSTETDFDSAAGTIIVDHNLSGAVINPIIAALDVNALLSSASSQGFSITDTGGEGFASSITTLGDVDSDGLDDLGFVKSADTTTSSGEYFGYLSATTVAGNLTVGNLSANNAEFVNTIGNTSEMQAANIGDFSNGASHYFAVSAPQADMTTGIDTGNVDIFAVEGSNTLVETLTGLTGLSLLGGSLTGIGDISGNGYDGLLIGASGTPGSGAYGAAYILNGGSTLGATVDVTAMSLGIGAVINGTAGEYLGTNVSGAGDFKNDGHTDFMVSAPGDDVGMNGMVYVYEDVLGTPTLKTTIDMDAMTPLNAGGTDPSQSMGIPLADLSDVNGGGVSDIGVLSYADNAFYGFFGSSSEPAVLHAHTNASFTIAPGVGSTILSAGAVGDFNGDGYNDIGVVIKTGTTADIYVVYGSSTLSGTLNMTALNNPNTAFHMTLDMTNVQVDPATGHYDITIGSAGDVNGDGFGDVVIGIPGLNNNNGAAVVVYGQPAGDSAIVTDGNPLDQSSSAHVIVAGANNESLVGDSSADTLSDNSHTGISFSAGAGGDTININNSLFQKIDGGTGNDTINFMTNGSTLDFSSLGSESVSHIEQINLNGVGQTLILNLANIMNMMETSDTGNLTITATGDETGGMLELKTGTGPITGASVNQIGGALTTPSLAVTETNGSTTDDFHFGNHTLSIDTHLISSAHVSIV